MLWEIMEEQVEEAGMAPRGAERGCLHTAAAQGTGPSGRRKRGESK